jgi:hypothetical protein
MLSDNLRYSINTCLFSYPQKPPGGALDSPCLINYGCSPLQAPLTADKLVANPDDAWDYCSADSSSFMGSNLGSCISCLQSSTDQVYLSNCMFAQPTSPVVRQLAWDFFTKYMKSQS